MKTQFAAAALIASTTAIKNSLKAQLNTYEEPFDILAQTSRYYDDSWMYEEYPQDDP